MPADCIFCKIVAGTIGSAKVYEDEHVFAFEDMHPVAKVHTLIVPKKHIASVNDLTPADLLMVGQIFAAAHKIAQLKKIDTTGYRVLTNTGANAGQTVFHLHYHLLGGEPLHPM